MSKKKRQEQDEFFVKMGERGIEITSYLPSKNPFKRFWEWLIDVLRDYQSLYS